MDKTGRNGLRVGDIELPDFKERYDNLVAKHIQLLKHYDFEYDLESLEADWFLAIDRLNELEFIDSEHYLDTARKAGKKVLAEGAQGSLLDIDFGTYPFVTSSNTVAAGACTGLGIAPNRIGDVFGIFKAYLTRVGSGPFPTELLDETGEEIQKAGNEFGATTGRPRRCGWIDLPALKYAININGVTQLMMMKADVLSEFPTIKVCTHYKYNGEIIDYLPYNIEGDKIEPIYKEFTCWKEDLTGKTEMSELPKELTDYVEYLEKELETPIVIVSVGPDRTQTIYNKK